MCRLLETIKISYGKLYNLDFHNQRANRARARLFGDSEPLDLSTVIEIPRDYLDQALVRCRVLFRNTVEQVEYRLYQFPVLRSLRIVLADTIEYSYKFEERGELQRLLALKGESDEIIIVKNGLVTDASIANLVFFDGVRYVTPARPLLAGTKRAALLSHGRISEADIRLVDLDHYRSVYLINSMIDLEDQVGVAITRLKTD